MPELNFTGSESETVSKLIEIIEHQTAQIQEMRTDLEQLKKTAEPTKLLKEQGIKTSRRKLLHRIAASAAGLTAVGIALQPKTIQAGGGIYSGNNDPNGSAIWGQNDAGKAIFGSSTDGYAIYGTSTVSGIGVRGKLLPNVKTAKEQNTSGKFAKS